MRRHCRDSWETRDYRGPLGAGVRELLRASYRPSRTLLAALPLVSGASQRSSHIRGVGACVAAKRSSRLAGIWSVSTGGTKSVRPSVQNGVDTNCVRHHVRHCATVERGTPNVSSCREAAAVPALARAALTTTMIAATYTRRPRKRTENGVVRRRHLAQQKL